MFSNPENSKFKDKMGRWLTKSLFKEYAFQAPEGTFPLFVLSNQDRDGLPSLYKLYLAAEDPSEYFFANEYLGGWDHWQRLSKATFFLPYITSWRKELEVLIKAKALQKLLSVANNPNHKSSYEANKLLLKEGYKEREGSKRGRPTKDEVHKEANRIATEEERISADAERVLQ